MIALDISTLDKFIAPRQRENLTPRLEAAHRALLNKTGEGSAFTGWRDLSLNPEQAYIADIINLATEIRESADVLLCIGIGGSYLGAKAVIDALVPYFGHSAPEVVFAGHHMSGQYLRQLLESLEGRSVYVNVISKSGTTLEPALSFRVVLDWMDQHFDDVDKRVIATTDPEKGALNALSAVRGFRMFEIPEDIGGRFSVLTPVGLLPIAAAGVDIRELLGGAREAAEVYTDPQDNPSLAYAAGRYLLHEAGYKVDLLTVFEPKLSSIGGWWQQLFGESEGKNLKGLFPATLQYSTDLHSLGQYVQDGQRIVSETFLMLKSDDGDLIVPETTENLDKLNYLAGRTFSEINQKAFEGTARAHVSGGVPVQTLWLEDISAESIGELIYFFEHAVAIGGYLLGINPFDQPGVEAYKMEMFSLLGKP